MCKLPLDYSKGEQLTGLITLLKYIEGGHELADVKIQVCVKSIGAKKKGLLRGETGFMPSLMQEQWQTKPRASAS